MSKFALRYPFFIIMLCMTVAVVGSATAAVMLSILLSALAAFLILNILGQTINAMVLGGLRWPFPGL